MGRRRKMEVLELAKEFQVKSLKASTTIPSSASLSTIPVRGPKNSLSNSRTEYAIKMSSFEAQQRAS